MNVVRSRLRYRVHHRTEVASVIARVRPVDHAKLPYPVERRAGALNARQADGVIRSVQPKEGAMSLAEATETELQNCLEKRRLRRRGGASPHICGWRQQ